MTQGLIIEDTKDCSMMAALGVRVEAGVVRPVAERDDIRASVITMMRAASMVYQQRATPPQITDNTDLRDELLRLSGDFCLPQDEVDPVRAALRNGLDLFDEIAVAILGDDLSALGVRQLPQSAFEAVPFFFDIEELADEVGYDITSFGDGGVGGETSLESYRYLSDKAGGGAGSPRPEQERQPMAGADEQTAEQQAAAIRSKAF